MLNRLFIAIGVLVILTLVTAFFVPRFITWADYRPRLEAMASAAFGTKVSIEGDIALTLLPQPELRMTKLKMGPPDAPVVEVADVEASFSLLDFLGDHYKVTRLTIDQPVVNVSVGADGSLSQGLSVAAGQAEPNVSVANAQVVDGVIHVSDARAGQAHTIEDIGGTLTLEAIRGPFNFEGQGTLEGKTYAAHIGLGSLDATAGPALSVFIQSQGARETLQADGTLKAGRYAGSFKYRQAPPPTKKGEATDAGRGNFSLDGKFDAGTDRVVLTDYTALPDENRPTTRLSGAAELRLGLTPSFNAVISGGSVVLPPRDATAEIGDPPYELVRLLGELPMPPVPPIAGTVGLDLTDLNLRDVSLRGLSLQAETDGKGWTLKGLTANLPGSTTLSLTGSLTAAGARPAFAGRLTIDSKQLDRLTTLWRKPAADDPLFDVPGSFSANLTLSADKLVVSSGALALNGAMHPLSGEIGIGPQRTLKLSADLGTLSADDSAALAALMPDLAGSGSFGATFPSGEIHLSAQGATMFGIGGTGLVADASWEGGVLTFSKLRAADLGGAAFDGTLTAFGTLVKPEISGAGSIKIAAGSTALSQLLAAFATPRPLADIIARALPADLTVKLDAPSGSGGQALAVVGTLGGTNAKFAATLSSGLINALKAPISARLDLDAGKPGDLVALLGLGEVPVFDATAPLHVTASVDGVPSNSYETHVALASGNDHLDFSGDVVPGDFSSVAGSGDIEVALADPSALAEALGVGGVYLPPISGKARLKFEGADSLKLSEIDAGAVTGSLALTREDRKATLTGALKLGSVDVKALLPFLVGAPGTLNSADSLWPDGPIDLGDAARTSEGRIDLTTPSLTSGGTPVLTDVGFGLDWDAQTLHLRTLTGKTAGGTATLDATLCCAGPNMTVKQLNGRMAVDGVDLAAIAPKPVAAVLTGTLQAGAEFSGSGASLADAIGALTGSGSYTITGFGAAHFDPMLFAGLGGLTNIVDIEPDVLTATVVDKLGAGPFKAASLTGGFTIAGGVLRSPNLAIEGEAARIFGNGTLDLSKLNLDGRYAMTPASVPDATSPLDPNSAQVDVAIGGSFWAPTATYDVAALVDGMKIKASEAELAILEQRKAEADARAKQQAAEDARRDAELKAAQAAMVAEQATEAAASIAADAAEKQAAEDAVKAKAAAAAASASAAASSSSSAAANDIGL